MPRKRRGYPVAVLVGLEGFNVRLWDVYSESVKPGEALASEGPLYSLYEAVVDQLRTRVRQGVNAVIVASAKKSQYLAFMAHVEKHHAWLTRGRNINMVRFTFYQGPAMTPEEVSAAVASNEFRSILRDASESGVDKIMGVLESRLNSAEGIDSLLLSLEDVEASVYGEKTPAFVLMTEGFAHRQGGRAQRLAQVAYNRNIKTVTIPEGSRYAARLEQLGGIVGLKETR